MRYKMYAVALATALAIASTGCQAIRVNNCESGSTLGCAGTCAPNQASCGCRDCQNAALSGGALGHLGGQNGVSHTGNCQNGLCDPSQMGGAFAGQGGGLLGSASHAGAYGGGMGGIDLSACPSCSQLGRPCGTCLAPGGRLAGLAGNATGKARGLFSGLIHRCAAHDCQTPYTQPFAESGLPGGPLTPTYGYPYYTTRAPRDFLMCNPPSIGP